MENEEEQKKILTEKETNEDGAAGLEQSESYNRTESNKSMGSYGATTASRRSSMRSNVSKGDPRYLKRTSSTVSTDQPFDRRSSVRLTSLSSGKSLTSVRTRHTSVSRSEYHADLKPDLEGSFNIKLGIATFVVAFGESFLFGWNIGVLNQPSKLIKTFYNETYTARAGEQVSDETVLLLWSLTNALFIPGGMIGAFLGGMIADKFGRKRGIMFSHIFTVLGAVMACSCVAAKSPELLMVGRILLGINNGLGNCLAPLFLTEIAPFNLRGALGTVHQLSVTLGILLSSVVGVEQALGTPNGWPFLMLLELLSVAVACIGLPFLPETPRYLLLCKGEREEAKKSLEFYRMSDDVVTQLEEMDTEHAESKQDITTAYTLSQFLHDKSLIRPLLVACMLQFVQQFSGINAVFFYSSGIFTNAGVADHQIPYTVIGTNAVNVAMTVIAVPLMEKSGRRPLLLFPMIAMVLDLIVLTVALHLQVDYTWLAYVSITCIVLYVIGFAVGLGPIPMMIASELFRQGPRPFAMACAGIVNWVCTFIIALSFEPLQNMIGEYVFVIFLFILSICLVLTYFFVPETKNKTVEQIAHEFSPGDHLEVEEVDEDDDNVFGDDDEICPNENEDKDEHEMVTINFKGNGGAEGQGAVEPLLSGDDNKV